MKKKLSKAKKGKSFSEEHKKALSLAKKGKRSSRASIPDKLAKQLKEVVKNRHLMIKGKTLKEIAKIYNVKLDVVKRISSGKSFTDL